MPLHENELLHLLHHHSGKSAKELAQLAGYITTTKTGQQRVKMLAFQNAVLSANNISFKPDEERGVKAGRKATYRIQVQQNGNLLIGAAYTRQMGLIPGTDFAIEIGRKHIKLVQIDSLPKLHSDDIVDLSNDELSQLAKSTFSAEEDGRLHELLDKKRADCLQVNEHVELENLLSEYDQGMLMKSKAMAEKHNRNLSQVATA